MPPRKERFTTPSLHLKPWVIVWALGKSVLRDLKCHTVQKAFFFPQTSVSTCSLSLAEEMTPLSSARATNLEIAGVSHTTGDQVSLILVSKHLSKLPHFWCYCHSQNITCFTCSPCFLSHLLIHPLIYLEEKKPNNLISSLPYLKPSNVSSLPKPRRCTYQTLWFSYGTSLLIISQYLPSSILISTKMQLSHIEVGVLLKFIKTL